MSFILQISNINEITEYVENFNKEFTYLSINLLHISCIFRRCSGTSFVLPGVALHGAVRATLGAVQLHVRRRARLPQHRHGARM